MAKKALAVDGRQWKEGQSSAGIADKARALYGERYAEFLDRVQAYAYFPYAVVPNVENFTGGEITVRFEGLSGRIDQGAGICSISSRTATTSRSAPTASKTIWCCGSLRRASAPRLNGCATRRPRRNSGTNSRFGVSGTKVEGYLDGKRYLEDTLAQPVSGRIGLWSKADSHMYFSDYTVTVAD